MGLSSVEHAWAVQIKKAVESDPDLTPLSDFMYAQFAIVTLQQMQSQQQAQPFPPPLPQQQQQQQQQQPQQDEEDPPPAPPAPPLDEIVERIRSLQSLREEMGITDQQNNDDNNNNSRTSSVEEGMTAMRRIICDIIPGWFLAMEYLPESNKYLRVVSLTSFDTVGLLNQPDKVKLWHTAIYYINHAHTPDLEAARQGFIQCIECYGYEWRNPNMFHIKAFQEAAPSFILYPINCVKSVHYNTGMFLKLLATLARRILPRRMTESFEFHSYGCGRDGGDSSSSSNSSSTGTTTTTTTTLMDIFAQPTMEESNERLCLRLEDALKRRYHHEAKFTL